jgi:peptidyl-dipeptidase A
MGRVVGVVGVVAALLWPSAVAGQGARVSAAEAEAVTPEAAARFVDQAEQRINELTVKASRAQWVQATYITDDTEELAADANRELIAATMQLAAEATRFDGLDLPLDVRRRLQLLKLSLDLPAPRDPAAQKELTRLAAELEGMYGKGKFDVSWAKEPLDINAATNILAESRKPRELLEVWKGWHGIAPPMRPKYARFVELANQGARALGYRDLGAYWRSKYDMPPEEFTAELERLWEQVRPLYLALHAHVRARLSRHYGSDVVAPDGPIPAHLLGNMWAQQWENVSPLVGPEDDDAGYDLTTLLRAKNVDEVEMVRYGERFFTSVGFDPLPPTFWGRSLFKKPRDREVVCHASAWDIDNEDDLRIKMCIEVTGEDFVTIHHELGHNFYQRAYRRQPPLYRASANDGFHEAIGDAVALSVTPDYLVKIGLLDRAPQGGEDVGYLLRMALDKVAFLPFGLLIDRWRWKVFSGDVTPADYNRAWWELRASYQGIAPPLPRSEADFDAGAKYHVPANVPYTRYFLAHILQFQFHRALCREAGFEGPLHQCSIYGNRAAGGKLRRMLEMGASRPWPEALEAMTGERRMDAGALLEYFAPLRAWLDEQNRDRKVGF